MFLRFGAKRRNISQQIDKHLANCGNIWSQEIFFQVVRREKKGDKEKEKVHNQRILLSYVRCSGKEEMRKKQNNERIRISDPIQRLE